MEEAPFLLPEEEDLLQEEDLLLLEEEDLLCGVSRYSEYPHHAPPQPTPNATERYSNIASD